MSHCRSGFSGSYKSGNGTSCWVDPPNGSSYTPCCNCDCPDCRNDPRKFGGEGPVEAPQETPPVIVEDPHVLPTDSEERKGIPIFGGCINYFPLALAAVARHSKMGNDKHNPGRPLHWARGKSMDHLECIGRHLVDVETVDPATGEYLEARALAWRALAHLEELEEKRLGKPMSRGSRPA
jgi:hypothetical protein